MADSDSLREELRKEKEKLAGLTARQKLQYFKDYYLVGTLVLAVIIIGVVYTVRTQMDSGRTIVHGGLWANVTADEAGYAFVDGDYFSYMGADAKKTKSFVSTDQHLYGQDSPDTQDTYAQRMTVITRIAAGELDFVFADGNAFAFFDESHAFADLADILTPEQTEAYADLIVTAVSEEGTEYPAALRITGTAFAEKYGVRGDDGEVYLGFIVNGNDLDSMSRFTEYLNILG